MDPSANGSPQVCVPSQAQHASAGQYHTSGKQGTARIKHIACPAIVESYHFINISRRLSYILDPQAKDLMLALLQWHDLTLQLCLQDPHHLGEFQQCQHTSQVTGELYIQQEQEILHKLVGHHSPEGTQGRHRLPFLKVTPCRRKGGLEGIQEREIRLLPSTSRGGAKSN